ncbi:hypothetical protein D187_004235 [Cystobacter fuscus DSM 2262]|uniref:Uncharacterized protein n=1 Tax=Cystobacter fuscus (strain ATCC 25194 / DSM 2262 / NBRC 100088 / M29) TaxID=1242864 RepID=S9QNT8_CYSF2|nr:hypothetical protein D187_004235 [Cystobacter fuscus DSM 2262]
MPGQHGDLGDPLPHAARAEDRDDRGGWQGPSPGRDVHFGRPGRPGSAIQLV